MITLNHLGCDIFNIWQFALLESLPPHPTSQSALDQLQLLELFCWCPLEYQSVTELSVCPLLFSLFYTFNVNSVKHDVI